MMDKYSYGLGLGMAQNLRSMGAGDICLDDFVQALRDVFEGHPTAITFGEARDIVNKHFAEIQQRAAAAATEQGETFLRMNKERPGVVTTKSGLQYQVLKRGNGRQPKATDRVRCHYEGRLIDGTLFDSSIERGEPAVFGVNQVIQGLTTDARRRQVEALHPLSAGLWRARCGRCHPPVQRVGIRGGTAEGAINSQQVYKSTSQQVRTII